MERMMMVSQQSQEVRSSIEISVRIGVESRAEWSRKPIKVSVRCSKDVVQSWWN